MQAHARKYAEQPFDPPIPAHAADPSALMQAGQFQTALAALQPMVAANPMDPALLDQVATCYWELGMTDRALEILRAIVDTWPDNTAVWGRLGARCLSMGHNDAARDAFEAILTLDPSSVPALTALNVITPFDLDSKRGRQLQKLANGAQGQGVQQASLFNAVARMERAADHPAAAMTWFDRANQATPGDYRPEEMERKLSEQRAAFAPGSYAVAEGSPDTPTLAFIVGLPRSGTTLLEKMLERHSGCASVGESPALINTRNAIRQHQMQTRGTTGHWDWCDNLPADVLAAARQVFLNQVRLKAETRPQVVLDKLPQNLFDLGFARMILPESRAIFMMRHPLDLGLSIYTTNFHQGHGYGRRMDWLGHMIRSAYDSLDDYRDKLGDQLRVQSYRALVEDPEPQLRAVLDHLGLDWQDECLHPEDSTTAIQTASITQIREGINCKGLGKWKMFEQQLAPLVTALGGWEWIAEWEERDKEAAAQ